MEIPCNTYLKVVKGESASGDSTALTDCATLTTKQRKLLQRFRTNVELLAAYTPDKQSAVAANAERYWGGESPALADVKQMFGRTVAEVWLGIQLQDLSEYAGTRLKLDTRQIDDTARNFVTEYPYITLPEFMIFFFRMKMGQYGRFYGAVDPILIAEAFKTFLSQRSTAIDRRECAERAKVREKVNEDAMTRHEWRTFKPWHQAGYSLEDWRRHQHALAWWWHFKDLPYNGSTNNFSEL